METLLNPYCSLEDVKQTLKLPITDTSKDDELTKAINLASRYIDERQKRDFFFHDYSTTALSMTRYNNFVSKDQIVLPFNPIITLTEVKEGTVVMVADTDYVLEGNIIYKRFGRWLPSFPGFTEVQTDSMEGQLPPPAAMRISIKGTFGYFQATSTDVPTGLPQHIRMCAREIAAVFSGHHRKEVVGLDGSKSSIVTTEIPKSVTIILGRQAPILV